ncbi:hypothetical protein, partial [Paraburkholderia sp.]|uniref:hypothetical protein n=1 Tax=Paraburkholderia sp. TaxID=1926495 RepID=UPI002B0009AC
MHLHEAFPKSILKHKLYARESSFIPPAKTNKPRLFLAGADSPAHTPRNRAGIRLQSQLKSPVSSSTDCPP